jgi:hypothetical protein
MGSILTSGWPQFKHWRVHIPTPPSEAPAMDKRSKGRARAGTAGRSHQSAPRAAMVQRIVTRASRAVCTALPNVARQIAFRAGP